jgi:prepilin-type N-terminal cleavage/methylation domain
MDIKKRRALTLIELLMAMLLGAILTAAVLYQLIAMSRSSNAIKNKADPSVEAYVAMDHMSKVLRFATTTPEYYSDFFGCAQMLGAQYEGGHVNAVPSNGWYFYFRMIGTNCFYFATDWTNQDTYVLLANDCTNFNATWDAAKKEIWVQLTFTKNGSSVTTETTIKVLGS